MGVVAKQSFYNSITIGLAFVIGALNTVFLYPTHMGSKLQGLVVALLALSNLVQPFISFGVQHAVIKFYSNLQTKEEKDKLLSFSLFLPLSVFVVLLAISSVFYSEIVDFIASENKEMGKYTYLILTIAFATALFEVFYNWLRIQLLSVFGNFLKEFFPRVLIFVLLLLYAFEVVDFDGFIVGLITGYYLRLLLVIIYSLSKYTPRFSLALPDQFKVILKYSLLIFMSGTAASLILDIDKSMISAILSVENVAFYSVAIFIAAVIEFPGRAMFQIISPLVAKALNEGDDITLKRLLKKSANNLLLISGLLFCLINLNLSDFYNWIDLGDYAVALEVVLIVSLGKLFTMSMGCLNNIITNSKYYVYVFWFSTISALLAVVLNLYLIQWYGITGAAYATLMVIVLINILKILLVQYRFKINPYSKASILTVTLILLVNLIFTFIEFDLSPFMALAVRSILIFLVFAVIAHLMKLTTDIQPVLKRILSSFQRT